eukprot:scaffold3183_cov381-Prasinococcus_capsulatus_cf.AAC.9
MKVSASPTPGPEPMAPKTLSSRQPSHSRNLVATAQVVDKLGGNKLHPNGGEKYFTEHQNKNLTGSVCWDQGLFNFYPSAQAVSYLDRVTRPQLPATGKIYRALLRCCNSFEFCAAGSWKGLGAQRGSRRLHPAGRSSRSECGPRCSRCPSGAEETLTHPPALTADERLRPGPAQQNLRRLGPRKRGGPSSCRSLRRGRGVGGVDTYPLCASGDSGHS